MNNHNLISNSSTNSETEKRYVKINKAQTNFGNLYNKKLDYEGINIDGKNYMIGNINNINYIDNIIQRNDNRLYQQNNEGNFEKKK